MVSRLWPPDWSQTGDERRDGLPLGQRPQLEAAVAVGIALVPLRRARGRRDAWWWRRFVRLREVPLNGLRRGEQDDARTSRRHWGQSRTGEALWAWFREGGQHLLGLRELFGEARASVDQLMNGAARQFARQLPAISVYEVDGQKHPGRRGSRVRGCRKRAGRIGLAETNLSIAPPGGRPGGLVGLGAAPGSVSARRNP